MNNDYTKRIAEAVREAAAKRIEDGSFLHLDSPAAQLAKQAAKAIRSLDLDAIIASVPEHTCEWQLDDDENMIWKSGCGELWSFIDGGPEENKMRHCHACGGKLKESHEQD